MKQQCDTIRRGTQVPKTDFQNKILTVARRLTFQKTCDIGQDWPPHNLREIVAAREDFQL
jgi:hypothetical protein